MPFGFVYEIIDLSIYLYYIEFSMRIQYYFYPVMHHFFRQLLLPTGTTVNLSGVSTLINFRVN